MALERHSFLVLSGNIITMNNPTNDADKPRNENQQSNDSTKAKVTHNLDTGEDEPLQDLEDKNIMDFASGSGGGSAGDGGGS
jgi:hypothetical protein